MMSRLARISLPSLAAIALGFATCGMAVAKEAGDEAYVAALARLQQYDTRLQSVGWRLAAANAPYCKDARPAIGLLLQDMMSYHDPDGIRAAIGLEGDVAVQALADNAPAARAGLLPGDEVLAIDDSALAGWPVNGAGDYRRLASLHDLIDEQLAAHGRITLRLRTGRMPSRDVTIHGEPACPSRFEVLTGKSGAQADGTRVVIGHRFGKGRGAADGLDDEEYAAVVAHELAHNLLEHRALLDKVGRSWGKVRRTEREADRLSVWLLANAGYRPEAGPKLMSGWGRRRDIGFLKIPTHESWDKRVANMEAEITRLHQALRLRGEADWARDFVPEE